MMLPAPRWQDLIDILIVAYVIYRLALLVRGTRTMQMVAGLAVLAAAFAGSQMLGLFTLNWLLNNFFGSLILILVVLFQADIRRALTGVATRSFLGFGSGAARVEWAELATAAAWLSARRIGALIVIERDVRLTEYVARGRPIDARVRPELLEAIFVPGSPLHDGAVIIKGDQVVAAGCVLPLSENSDASLALGTRHRAAIGITEESDAVAIVVSEEDGTISLAEQGRLVRGVEQTGLLGALQKIFESASEGRGPDEAR